MFRPRPTLVAPSAARRTALLRAAWAPVALVLAVACVSSSSDDEPPQSATPDEQAGGPAGGPADVATGSSLVDGVVADGERTRGGQSGGETGGKTTRPAAQFPAVCACLGDYLEDDAEPVAVRVEVLRLDGSCVELEVVEELADLWGIEPGDVIGGSWRAQCEPDAGQELEFVEGEQALAIYTRGYQNYATCPAYQACSAERCGPEPGTEAEVNPSAEPTDPDLDGADQNADQGSADQAASPPAQPVDSTEPADGVTPNELASWDECDTQCIEETREVCAVPEDQLQVGGSVRLLKLDDDTVSFFWAGEQREQALDELSQPGCREEHQRLADEHWAALPAERAAATDDAASNESTSSTSADESSAELAASPAPAPEPSDDAAAANQCPAPGWERHFDTPGDAGTAPDPGTDSGAPDASG